jgi:hypothetical protein
MIRRLVIAAIALLVLGPGPAAGDEASSQPFSLAPSGDLALAGPEESPPPEPCDGFHLFLAEESPADCPRVAAAEDPAPGSEQGREVTSLRKPWYYSALAWGAPIGLTAAGLVTSLTDSPLRSFRFANEGWFGTDTYAGGADKAAHFVNYTIVSKEMAYLYQKLGYSESASIWLGFSLSILEGFSPQDATMDILGSGASALILATGTEDLFGFRNGFLLPKSTATCCQVPGKGRDYSYGIYTVDLKLAGVGRRLGLHIGPLRYLYFSVTYGSKFYPSGPPDLRERQVGFEIGLNFEEILNSIGISRERWWGYGLHVILDNIRFPFTSVGFQYDLNHGKWYGPGNGNEYSTTP